jgi:hypothetical protein
MTAQVVVLLRTPTVRLRDKTHSFEAGPGEGQGEEGDPESPDWPLDIEASFQNLTWTYDSLPSSAADGISLNRPITAYPSYLQYLHGPPPKCRI